MYLHPIPLPLLATAPALGARVSALLISLATLIAARLLRHPRYAIAILPLWTRLTRAARRFDRAMASLAAGRPTRSQPPRPGRPGGAPPARLPARRAWLLEALRHEGGHFTQLIERMLSEPETAALIAASPQALRILRPICRMLGVTHAAIPALPRRHMAPPQPHPRATPQPPAAQEDWQPPPFDPDMICPRIRHRWPFREHPAFRTA